MSPATCLSIPLFITYYSLGVVLTGVTLKVGFGAVIFTYAIMVGWGVGGAYGLVLSMASSVMFTFSPSISIVTYFISIRG